MTEIKGQNYSRKTDLVFRDTQFTECNFSQSDINTVLDIENCKFIDCNLVNCLLSENNEIIDCNNAQTEIE
jgi:hypothetical protein